MTGKHNVYTEDDGMIRFIVDVEGRNVSFIDREKIEFTGRLYIDKVSGF